jgi:hypothetical protein
MGGSPSVGKAREAEVTIGHLPEIQGVPNHPTISGALQITFGYHVQYRVIIGCNHAEETVCKRDVTVHEAKGSILDSPSHPPIRCLIEKSRTPISSGNRGTDQPALLRGDKDDVEQVTQKGLRDTLPRKTAIGGTIQQRWVPHACNETKLGVPEPDEDGICERSIHNVARPVGAAIRGPDDEAGIPSNPAGLGICEENTVQIRRGPTLLLEPPCRGDSGQQK